MKAIERKMNSNNPDTDLLHAEQICRHRHTQTQTHTHTQTYTHADTCSVALVDTEAWHLAPDTWHFSLTSALHLAGDRFTGLLALILWAGEVMLYFLTVICRWCKCCCKTFGNGKGKTGGRMCQSGVEQKAAARFRRLLQHNGPRVPTQTVEA